MMEIFQILEKIQDIVERNKDFFYFSILFFPLFSVTRYPTDCIILAYSSHSWGQYTHSNPDMGDAFVDYYADAFVGSITTISKTTTGDYSEVFWDVLSIDNDDVEDATRDLCTAGSWTYNTHWKILGDTSATLP